MSKIDELIDSIRQSTGGYYPATEFYDYSIERIMKEYAEWYAHKCLEKFEKDSDPVYDMQGDFLGYSTPYLENFKLPEHE